MFFQRVKHGLASWALLDSLKNNSDSLVTNRKDINHLFIEHFKAIFASNNPVWDESLSDLISPCISDEDNEILTRVPMEEEIKKAVFNIDFHKAPALDGYTAFF